MRIVAALGAGAVTVAGIFSTLSPVSVALRKGKPLAGVVMGTDVVKYAEHSDTLLLWRYDPGHKRLDVLSIPRDTRIDIPGYTFSRINAVYAHHFGVVRKVGPAALKVMEAVRLILGDGADIVDPRYYFHLNFDGFRRFIDILGGIRVRINEPMHYDDNAGDLHIHWDPGVYFLNGEDALRYVRFRGKSGDRGRVLRQMEFMKSLSEKLYSPVFYLRWPRLLWTAAGSFHTNLSLWDILCLALEAKHVGPENVNPSLLPGRPRGASWEVDPERLLMLLKEMAGISSSEVPPAAAFEKKTTVKVWNGTHRTGLALDVSRRLRDAGFDVLEWGTYAGRQSTTRVMDRAGTIEKAKNVAQTLGVRSVYSDVDPALRTDVEVVLGEDYEAGSTNPPATPTPYGR